MATVSLEERVEQLERRFADFQEKFGEAIPHNQAVSRPNLPNEDKVDASYWQARTQRLARVNALRQFDSTLAVSKDRDNS